MKIENMHEVDKYLYLTITKDQRIDMFHFLELTKKEQINWEDPTQRDLDIMLFAYGFIYDRCDGDPNLAAETWNLAQEKRWEVMWSRYCELMIVAGYKPVPETHEDFIGGFEAYDAIKGKCLRKAEKHANKILYHHLPMKQLPGTNQFIRVQ